MKTTIRFMELAWSIYPQLFFLLAFSALIQSFSSLFTVYALAYMMDVLEKGLVDQSVKTILCITIIEGVFFLLKRIMKAKMETAKEKMNERVNQKISDKIMTLPFACLEDTHYVQLKNDAIMGMNNMGAVYTFFDGFTGFATNIVVILTLSVVLFQFDRRLIAVLGIGVLCTLAVTLIATKQDVDVFKKLLPINFRYGYYLDTLLSPSLAKDFRIYSVYDVMDFQLHTYVGEMGKYFRKIATRRGLFDALLSCIRYGCMGGIYTLVGIETIQRNLPVSQFTLITTSAVSFSAAVSAMIIAGSGFTRGVEYVKPVLTFMNMQETCKEGDKELKEIETITFEHVTFHYPHTQVNVLEDVSFTIHKHEKISIVGLNGAGKTTIVKLLCKLYPCDSGEIKINGINIDAYSNTSYMQQISSIFQDYKLFNYSIRENVQPDMSKEKCKEVLIETGVYDVVEKLPAGMESSIGKSYDEKGVELSGGQLQKIAIARAISKPSQILILDEPTSALDPKSEADIYENFNRLAKDKTALYISHRMSSSMFCDKILVLNNGKVEAFAPHKELMKDTDSLYYKLFTTQALNYSLK